VSRPLAENEAAPASATTESASPVLPAGGVLPGGAAVPQGFHRLSAAELDAFCEQLLAALTELEGAPSRDIE
jgi:hypothetical protein